MSGQGPGFSAARFRPCSPFSALLSARVVPVIQYCPLSTPGPHPQLPFVEGVLHDHSPRAGEDRRLYSVDVNRSVLEAARYMMEHNVGAVPVLRDGDLAGILSERDIMNRVVAIGRTPGTTSVSEVMTPNPRAVAADESLEECLFIMQEFGFR